MWIINKITQFGPSNLYTVLIFDTDQIECPRLIYLAKALSSIRFQMEYQFKFNLKLKVESFICDVI